MRTTALRFESFKRRGLFVTTFMQSLGAELLTNGDFSVWTGDNPDGWTITGEVGSDPMVTQVGNAARLYSSATSSRPTILQVILAIGGYYEIGVDISAQVSGTIQSRDSANAFASSYNAVRVYAQLGRAAGTSYALNGEAPPTDATVNNASVKRLTLNTQKTANLNATHTFRFTLPGSPLAGQEVHMSYRIPASDPFLNSWDTYLRRNATNTAWDFRLDSIVAGTRTNRVNVTSVGTPDAIMVVTSGDTHQCYTGLAGTFTARGGVVTNTTHNTATGINTIYSSAVTPISLESI